MKTIAIQIGNSDDKLSQIEWAAFCAKVNRLIDGWAEDVHFTGFSTGSSIWQNATWIIACKETDIEYMKGALKQIRKDFKQDSIAWLEGEVLFI